MHCNYKWQLQLQWTSAQSQATRWNKCGLIIPNTSLLLSFFTPFPLIILQAYFSGCHFLCSLLLRPQFSKVLKHVFNLLDVNEAQLGPDLQYLEMIISKTDRHVDVTAGTKVCFRISALFFFSELTGVGSIWVKWCYKLETAYSANVILFLSSQIVHQQYDFMQIRPQSGYIVPPEGLGL